MTNEVLPYQMRNQRMVWQIASATQHWPRQSASIYSLVYERLVAERKLYFLNSDASLYLSY